MVVRQVNRMPTKLISVVIADDKKEDRILLKQAIERHAAHLHVAGEVEDGLQLIDYLSGKNEYADRGEYPFPDLLVMDLRMPQVDGFQVLEWLQKHPFPQLKVAVLADSSGIAYRSEAMKMGAHFFHPKVSEPAGLKKAVTELQQEMVSTR
jgi:CheY-like chemotaxis protein